MSRSPRACGKRSPPTGVTVKSDLPRRMRLLPWERELLLPVVESLLADALSIDPEVVQTDQDGEDDQA